MKQTLKQQYGIIDIGSNTMRLVIYEKRSSGMYRELENTKISARLRNYLSNDDVLTGEGINLLLQTLQQFQISTRYHKLQHVICTATATVRQAANQQEIKRLVAAYTDFELRILSEYEEAYYGYMAVMNSTPFSEGITVDIGGGSTEVTYFKNRELQNYHSFPFGALSLKQQFIQHDMPTSEELENLVLFLQTQFQTLPWLKGKKLPLIAIGGSARNMVKVHQNLVSYPIYGLHLYEMNENDIPYVKQQITSLPFVELQKLEGLAKDRADTIIPAIQVFQTLTEITKASSFILSGKGLREGVFYEELIKSFGLPYYPNVIEESFYLLAREYEMDMNHAIALMKISSILCQGLQMCEIAAFTPEDRMYMRWGAKVFHIGNYIDSESSSQHTFYLLANKTIDGMMHKERVKLALMASYKSKLLFRQYSKPFEAWFTKEEQRHIRLMGSILQFASSLNTTNRNIIEDITVVRNEDKLLFYIVCNDNAMPERIQAEKQKKALEKVLKCTIELYFHRKQS
ncbi:Ppx/GppA family phosphatase [Bacillus sp. 165]|uniref:Ppx/GppA family phosphatase n=1 Tax=Bacillus sp. 165 TaxID=1529117 RepID=UPI001ADD03CC|nr:Ppx/GppA family phosphatase [Bacillus sp. 165]MBO9130364.1 Ppx/GppA family phosphatase [Bacillus sp. 165]